MWCGFRRDEAMEMVRVCSQAREPGLQPSAAWTWWISAQCAFHSGDIQGVGHLNTTTPFNPKFPAASSASSMGCLLACSACLQMPSHALLRSCVHEV